jgi:hypothetical protein
MTWSAASRRVSPVWVCTVQLGLFPGRAPKATLPRPRETTRTCAPASGHQLLLEPLAVAMNVSTGMMSSSVTSRRTPAASQ